MDNKDEFELDFDFEKEYGFSPEDIMAEDADFDLAELEDDDILKLSRSAPEQPEEAPMEEDFSQEDYKLLEDYGEEPLPEDMQDYAGEASDDEDAPQQGFEDAELPDPDQERAQKKFSFSLPPIFARKAPKPRRQNPLKAGGAPLIPDQEGEAAQAEADQTEAAPVPQAEAAPTPRRRKRSQLRVIKEDYLPYGIAGVALLLCLVFIVGSVVRTIRNNGIRKENEINASIQAESEAARQEQEAQDILRQAEELANSYDFQGAIDLIDSFSGSMNNFTELLDARGRYAQTQSTMVEISDYRNIPNLSFHVLIADPATAFNSKPYGPKYLQNFVTIDEFQRILEQLYEKGYVLVNFDDFIEEITDINGNVTFQTKSIQLPAGKKPVMITETLVNYFDYMVDGDDDGIPDKDGDGFANKLVVKDGRIVSQRVNSAGETVYGNYDLVPILNSFIDENPDFSYRGARATLAVTGAEGIFGYRINKGDADEINACKQLVQALRDDGYLLACNSYANISYATIKTTDIQSDLEKWTEQITPVIGDVEILVYALGSDISDYNGSKYNVMKNAGFKYFVSNTTNSIPTTEVNVEYVRQYRIMVTGSLMINSPDSVSDYFTVSQVLNNDR